ncbi:MAG: hypothetical protein IJT03_06495 [Clostridia bacterium]|nr:hypothetical protein [Clostridia bacterium]
MNRIIAFLLAFIFSFSVPSSFITSASADSEVASADNFFTGTGGSADGITNTGKWRLGYSKQLLTPDDFGSKTYYAGGNFSVKATEHLFNGFCVPLHQKYTDIYTRAIAVEDGSGRGISAIAVADCIGLTNVDVRNIRALILQKAGDDFRFADITIGATHCHSCIDTQGVWSNPLRKGSENLLRLLLGQKDSLVPGYDSEYMKFLYEQTAEAVIDACRNMQPGTLTYTSKEIGNSEHVYYEEYDWEYVYNIYFHHKANRSTSIELNANLSRFVFHPENSASRPVMLVNFAAHPYYTAYPDNNNQKGDGLSGDFIYYMDDIISKAGYDFLFFNGSLASVYTQDSYVTNRQPAINTRDAAMRQYGTVLGKIALSMTKTRAEIEADPFLVDKEKETEEREIFIQEAQEDIQRAEQNGYPPPVYFCWYEWHTPSAEVTLPPQLDTYFSEVQFEINNPILYIGGKLNLVPAQQVKKNGKTYIVSEIGLLQFGGKVSIVLVPGELFPELEIGGKMLTAQGSCRGVDFPYPPLREMLGEHIIVFGLANDAVGYIIPDNDYKFNLNVREHYHELLSLGRHTASEMMGAFQAMVAENEIPIL